MKHSDGVSLVLLELSNLGCLVARHFCGTVYTRTGQPYRLGTDGHADVSGETPDGRAIAVEVKVGRDSTRQNQRDWAAAWQQRGGLYAVIHPDRAGWADELRSLVHP